SGGELFHGDSWQIALYEVNGHGKDLLLPLPSVAELAPFALGTGLAGAVERPDAPAAGLGADELEGSDGRLRGNDGARGSSRFGGPGIAALVVPLDYVADGAGDIAPHERRLAGIVIEDGAGIGAEEPGSGEGRSG